MATAPLALFFSAKVPGTATPPGSYFRGRPEPPVRRRGSLQQGRALEVLGHAIEYLADSRMFREGDSSERVRAQEDAMQLLMRASRAVFLECPEAVPVYRKVGRWVSARLVGMSL